MYIRVPITYRKYEDDEEESPMERMGLSGSQPAYEEITSPGIIRVDSIEVAVEVGRSLCKVVLASGGELLVALPFAELAEKIEEYKYFGVVPLS